MILHLALFTWRDDVDDAAVADLERALADMAGRLRMLRGYRCGGGRGGGGGGGSRGER